MSNYFLDKYFKRNLLFVIVLLVGGWSQAADLDPSLKFFGRWDLRAPDRAITVNSGSYICAQFSSPTVGALFDTSANQAPLPIIAWKIDDGKWQVAEIAPKVNLAKGLSDGPHTLMLMMRGMNPEQKRWKPPLVGSYTFLGLDLSESGQILPPLDGWEHPKLKIEFLGDSITEGLLTTNGPTYAWHQSALDSYAAQAALQLGAMWRHVGFGAQGLVNGGSGGVPDALDSFNYFYDGCPRDDWQPDLVVINQGTNDRHAPDETYKSLYTRYLKMVRKAYPHAKIAAMRPFSGWQGDNIKAVVDACRAEGDKNIFYIDTTGWYTGHDLHPHHTDSPALAEKLVAALKADVLDQ